jgi:hypothetical protein
MNYRGIKEYRKIPLEVVGRGVTAILTEFAPGQHALMRYQSHDDIGIRIGSSGDMRIFPGERIERLKAQP